MLKQGTMRPVKQVLGAVLLVAGVGFLFNIQPIQTFISLSNVVSGVVLAGSGYLLIIAGRQR